VTAPLIGVARGVLLLARFRSEGLRYFGGSTADVLASLAPLLAFPLALGLLLLMAGAAHELAAPLAAGGAVLAPLVVSDLLARLWRREAEWGRYAASYNWCQWPITVVAILVVAGASVLGGLGVPRQLAGVAALAVAAFYQLAVHWFLARRALSLPWGKATILTILVDLSAVALLTLFLVLDTDAVQDANGSSG
jgi:hypothetical protein